MSDARTTRPCKRLRRGSGLPRLLACVFAGCASLAIFPALPGCASGQRRVHAEMPPEDFMVSVTLMPARPRFATPGNRYTPARYVVEADGVLRAAVGEGVSPDLFPGRMRDLTPDEQAALWRVTRDSGALDTDDPRVLPGETGARPDPLRRAVVWARGGGVSGAVVVDPANDAGVRALIELLEELAWVRTPWDLAPAKGSEDDAEADPAPWDDFDESEHDNRDELYRESPTAPEADASPLP